MFSGNTCYRVSFFINNLYFGIPEKSDPGPGTRNLGPIRGTREPGPSTWDPLPGTWDQEPIGVTRAPEPLSRTWNLGPSTRHPSPWTRDLGLGTLYGTGTKYLYVECGTHTLNTKLGILTLIQLSFSVWFSSVAQLFQTGNYEKFVQLDRRIDYAIKNIYIDIYVFGFFRTYSKITWSGPLICNKGDLCY